MDLVMRGRVDANPMAIRLGLAFALSFAGFIVTQFRRSARPRRSPRSASRPRPFPGAKSQAIGKSGAGLKEELRMLINEEALAKIGTSTTTTTTTTTTTVMGLSPTSKSSRDTEGFLLSEFHDLMMKELRATGKDIEIATNAMPKKPEINNDSTMEQEIACLKNLVWSLQEKEQSLELQLLEYCGMQEQEAAVRELQSQLKILSVEAQLYSLKIESLQADNRRLKNQLTDYSIVANELEAAKATIKLLKKKLKSDGEQAKEKIASLHQRISLLQRQEQKEAQDNEEVERKVKRLKELENEAAELKLNNSRLAEENSDLANKLESALEAAEADALEEVNCLRESNKKLMEEIEQLKTDRCADVEQLVYLKWVNACLRYELRNYQPPPGKTAARDLSNNFSPRSEEKAKELILEYANSGGDDKSLCSTDFDSEYSSSSRASPGEPENASIDVSSMRHNNMKKKKFLSKLKKLVLGKDTNSDKASATDGTPLTPRTPSACSSRRRTSLSISSIDDVIGRDSHGSFSSSMTEELNPANQLSRINSGTDERCHNEDAWSQVYSRPSLDLHALQNLNLEEAGRELDECYNVRECEGGDNTSEKAEIKKFAVASKKGRGISKVHRRSVSFSNFAHCV